MITGKEKKEIIGNFIQDFAKAKGQDIPDDVKSDLGHTKAGIEPYSFETADRIREGLERKHGLNIGEDGRAVCNRLLQAGPGNAETTIARHDEDFEGETEKAKHKQMTAWDILKMQGSDHYKGGLVEPIDLFRDLKAHDSLTVLQVKALSDCIKYAYRQLTKGMDKKDCEKINHYIALAMTVKEGCV
jgi:hypothetical protein